MQNIMRKHTNKMSKITVVVSLKPRKC